MTIILLFWHWILSSLHHQSTSRKKLPCFPSLVDSDLLAAGTKASSAPVAYTASTRAQSPKHENAGHHLNHRDAVCMALRNLRGPLFFFALVSSGAGAIVYKVHYDQGESKRRMRANLPAALREIEKRQQAKRDAATTAAAAPSSTPCETCDLKTDSAVDVVERARAQAAAQFQAGVKK